MTADEIAQVKTKISEAETAYHNLATGRMPRVVVDQNGERVEFTATNRQTLYNYIQELKRLLPMTEAAIPVARPIGFLF